jgi:hypothetical protein
MYRNTNLNTAKLHVLIITLSSLKLQIASFQDKQNRVNAPEVLRYAFIPFLLASV